MRSNKGLFVLPVLALFLACGAPSSNGGGSESSSESAGLAVENVRVEKEHRNAHILKGTVRNNSQRAESIAVRIQFLDANGDVLHANRAVVNNWAPVDPGQAAPFEYAASPETFAGAVDFKVVPYKR